MFEFINLKPTLAQAFTLFPLQRTFTLQASKKLLIITSKLFKSHKVKFFKNLIPPLSNYTYNATLKGNSTTPCAKCTKMGSTTNLVLTSNHSIVCKVMNKFVTPKSKKQHTKLLFILYLTFNKFETSLKAFVAP